MVDSIGVGGISDPLPYKTEQTEPSYHIVFVKKMIQEHKANLKDDSKEIEIMATEFKKRKLYSKWLESLRKELYWEIKN